MAEDKSQASKARGSGESQVEVVADRTDDGSYEITLRRAAERAEKAEAESVDESPDVPASGVRMRRTRADSDATGNRRGLLAGGAVTLGLVLVAGLWLVGGGDDESVPGTESLRTGEPQEFRSFVVDHGEEGRSRILSPSGSAPVEDAGAAFEQEQEGEHEARAVGSEEPSEVVAPSVESELVEPSDEDDPTGSGRTNPVVRPETLDRMAVERLREVRVAAPAVSPSVLQQIEVDLDEGAPEDEPVEEGYPPEDEYYEEGEYPGEEEYDGPYDEYGEPLYDEYDEEYEGREYEEGTYDEYE